MCFLAVTGESRPHEICSAVSCCCIKKPHYKLVFPRARIVAYVSVSQKFRCDVAGNSNGLI